MPFGSAPVQGRARVVFRYSPGGVGVGGRSLAVDIIPNHLCTVFRPGVGRQKCRPAGLLCEQFKKPLHAVRVITCRHQPLQTKLVGLRFLRPGVSTVQRLVRGSAACCSGDEASESWNQERERIGDEFPTSPRARRRRGSAFAMVLHQVCRLVSQQSRPCGFIIVQQAEHSLRNDDGCLTSLVVSGKGVGRCIAPHAET